MGGYKPDEATTRKNYDAFMQKNPGRQVSYENYAQHTAATADKYSQAGNYDDENGVPVNSEINKSSLLGLTDSTVEDDNKQSTALKKASGAVTNDEEGYSERMKGRFKKGLQRRG